MVACVDFDGKIVWRQGLPHRGVDSGLCASPILFEDCVILSGIAIWLTNVLIFALWYWQLDRGGPANRARHPDPTTREGRPDFVFSEMNGGRAYLPDAGVSELLALARSDDGK